MRYKIPTQFGVITGMIMGMIMGLFMFANAAIAGDDPERGDDTLTQTLDSARMEGQLWATFALNRHLESSDLTATVVGDTATLEGQVDEPIKKDLAKQLALSIDGIDQVHNRIEVTETVADLAPPEQDRGAEQERSFGEVVRDATTTASVKSKLLWNRSTAGLAIDVSTRNGTVILKGEAESETSRELAETLAINTEGVNKVVNEIRVSPSQRAERAERTESIPANEIQYEVQDLEYVHPTATAFEWCSNRTGYDKLSASAQ